MWLKVPFYGWICLRDEHVETVVNFFCVIFLGWECEMAGKEKGCLTGPFERCLRGITGNRIDNKDHKTKQLVRTGKIKTKWILYLTSFR